MLWVGHSARELGESISTCSRKLVWNRRATSGLPSRCRTLRPVSLLFSLVIQSNSHPLLSVELTSTSSTTTSVSHSIQRLTDAKFPVVDLTTQFRMHPRLAEFPSKHTYNRKPKIHPSTKSSVTLNYMSAAIREWLSIADKVALISVIGVNVYDNAGLADETKSRYNVENFKAVIELIIILIRNKGFQTPRSMMIITRTMRNDFFSSSEEIMLSNPATIIILSF